MAADYDYDALVAQRLIYHKVPLSNQHGLAAVGSIAEVLLFNDKLNIFALDKEEMDCAQSLCDRHVRDRGLHYAQILSNVHHHFNKTCGRFADGRPNAGRHAILPALYVDHPSCVWARQSNSNYLWLLAVLTVTWSEYKYRFRRPHRFAGMLRPLSDLPNGIPLVKGLSATPPPQCLREEFRIVTTVANFRSWENTIDAYREYYVQEYTDAHWTLRMPPGWFVKSVGMLAAEVEASFEVAQEARDGGKKFKVIA
jgi:hypothetical protein